MQKKEVDLTHAVIPDCSMKGMNVYQSKGSGITYYRRYMLSSMLGIISDADDRCKHLQYSCTTS